MKFVKWVLQWARAKGYGAMYGNPSHINRMMSDVDYSQCTDGVAVFAHLITSGETAGGRDRSTAGIFFSKLCDFDFDPEALLNVQQDLQDIGKTMLADMLAGNGFDYSDPVRWQYGYDDYADNVAWVCLRITAEALAVDCVPLEIPGREPARWITRTITSPDWQFPHLEYDEENHEFSAICLVVSEPYQGVTAKLNGEDVLFGIEEGAVITEENYESVHDNIPELTPDDIGKTLFAGVIRTETEYADTYTIDVTIDYGGGDTYTLTYTGEAQR